MPDTPRLPFLLLVASLGCFAGGCAAMVRAALTPDEPFDVIAAPPAPDYANPAAWAARPGVDDLADVTAAGETDAQSLAAADVFFVHPTTYYDDAHWNQPLDDATANDRTDRGVLRNQASAFNAAAAVHAPRYRQATLGAFLADDSDSATRALDLAYGDVRTAFDEFLAGRAAGRPFIIASHSQGSIHAFRLLAQEVSGTPLRDQLVVAYVIGMALPEDTRKQMMPDIPPCDSPAQTGCLVSWSTIAADASRDRFEKGTWVWGPNGYESSGGKTFVCVNPLSWRADDREAPPSEHEGAVRFTDEGDQPAPRPQMTSAQCVDGLLVVGEVDDVFRKGLGRAGDYHLVDYSLFYMDIRRNAVERVEAFMAAQTATQPPIDGQ